MRCFRNGSSDRLSKSKRESAVPAPPPSPGGSEIVGFEDFGVVVEHLAVIDVVINMDFVVRIFSKELQQIQQMFSFP